MDNRDKYLEARDKLFILFAQKIKDYFNDDEFLGYDENDRDTINFNYNQSQLHVAMGQKSTSVTVIFNFWEDESMSLDLYYEDGLWIPDPNENWGESDMTKIVNEKEQQQFIEYILEKFKLKANESHAK